MLVEQDKARRQSPPDPRPGSNLDEDASGSRDNEHEHEHEDETANTWEKLQKLQNLETQLRSKNELLLHEAGAKHGDVDVAERLLGEGANLDCRDNNDARRTPLHKACAAGTVGMIRFLALRGRGSEVVVNMEDSHGETPLHLVAGRDWVEMEGGEEGEEDGVMAATELLLHGADTGRQDSMGWTALHRAVTARNAKIGGYLTENADVDIADLSGRRALHLCVAAGSVEMVHGLLRHGAVIDRRDRWGRTALHEACGRGWKEGVEALLCHGPDISLEDEDGLTGMQLARDRGADDIVELLEDRIGKSASYDRVRPTTSQHEEPVPDTGIKDQGNIWAGVTREDGDGFLLASYNKHDISFAAKLESISPCVHEGKDMHEVQIKLNFMRPYSMDHRIRYAKVDAMLSAGSGAPNIRGIMPQADRVEVSEQEVSSGQKFTVGAAGGGGPSNLNISLEGSKNKTSTFKGVRIIHGAIQDKTHASWRLYEEPGSKSGLPEIVRLLLLVHCSADFNLQLGLSVTACHFLTFGIPRTLKAPAGLSYTVPKLSVIAAYEQESRLKQVLDVADRAAAVVEEAKRLQDMFSQAMRGHEKRGLIMEAGSKVNHFQEWTDILDDSRFSDFRALQGKLLELDESPRRTRRIIERTSWDDSISEPRVERGASGRNYGRVRIERPYGGYSRRRRDDDDDSYTYRPRRRRDYDDDEIYGDDPYTPRPRNAIHSFSAVGPGYHVSRLA
ncbi:hypothetical protein ASPVEDRAFT_77990 [Aspergillus versicolor CBS 583.65]|uniref:Uncharacterized protein n=1 Tax=Aspergillus versicolor CBS 583.65 TaxID=1036611 RepID=A0A1L9P3W3_ASPVE|nr:uncharacterized protein ASPVEDRAFT_77990 [Aspergillus versicolor CBS 583.65]OJI96211.1 hypothetical protein ASPVEDRAFT_77990 [Aspergillus versicolor CBS 583.65]